MHNNITRDSRPGTAAEPNGQPLSAGLTANDWIHTVARSDLPKHLRLVALTLLRFADTGTGRVADLGTVKLARWVGYSKPLYAGQALKELRARGWIVRLRGAGPRAGSCAEYVLSLPFDLDNHLIHAYYEV